MIVVKAPAGRSGQEGSPIRSAFFYLMVLPLLVMVVLGVLRVRFAVWFWRRMYIIGVVYVVFVLVRLAFELWR